MKTKNLEDIIKDDYMKYDYMKYDYDDLYKEYDIDLFKKQREWGYKREELTREDISLSQLISLYGLKSVISQLIDRYPIEDILELLDIKDIQQFLRKKKLEQIKSSDNDV